MTKLTLLEDDLPPEPVNTALPIAPTGRPTILSGHFDVSEGMTRILESARYNAVILSANLHANLYGESGFTAAAKRLLLLHPHARLRVLLGNADALIKSSHGLRELGLALPNRLEFRELAADQPASGIDWLIVDGRVLCEYHPDNMALHIYHHEPAYTQERLRNFDLVWERSPGFSEFRSLPL